MRTSSKIIGLFLLLHGPFIRATEEEQIGHSVTSYCKDAQLDPLFQFLKKKSQQNECRQVLNWLAQQEVLDISGEEAIGDIRGLAFAFELKWLIASHTGISDISALAHLPLLLLDISFSHLTKITSLPASLLVLDISHTDISSLETLSRYKNLMVLDAYGVNVPDTDLSAFKKHYGHLFNPNWHVYGKEEGRAPLPPTVTHCTEPGLFTLSFDDGPSEYTEGILDILVKEQIKAAFFLVGSRLENKKYRDLAVRMVREGHVVGNHTWSHPLLIRMPIKTIKQEIEKTSALIKDLTGIEPKFFRPPYGAITHEESKIINSMGFTIVLWDTDSLDYVSKLSGQTTFYLLYKNIVKSDIQRESFISLEHDIHHSTLETLSEFIQLIRAKGYKIVSLTECIGSDALKTGAFN